MNPPLRAKEDVAALLEGIADGTMGILCSDHAPHAKFEKEVEFDAAPFGIVGLETELGLFLDLLVHKHKTIDLPRLIEMYTVNPARLLQIEAGTLSPGRIADVTLIDPELEWTFDVERLAIDLAQHTFRWMEAEGPRGPDDCRRKDSVEVVGRSPRRAPNPANNYPE